MALRLLCDEMVDRANFYCQHVLDQPTLGAGTSDSDIRKYAVSNSLTILTNDGDFRPKGGANPNNGTWPGVIYYDDDASVGKRVDAIRNIEGHLSTASIANYHEQQQQILYIPSNWT